MGRSTRASIHGAKGAIVFSTRSTTTRRVQAFYLDNALERGGAREPGSGASNLLRLKILQSCRVKLQLISLGALGGGVGDKPS